MRNRERDTGAVRAALAAAIRQVNAAHERAGSPDLPGLRQAWLRLDRDLHVADLLGDPTASHNAVERYRLAGLAVIAEYDRKAAA